MKRMISAVMAIALMLALVGCGNSAQTTPTTAAPATQAPATDAPATEAPETEAAAELSGTVSTDGSTSMEAVIGALGEAFMEANPDVNFTYNPTGSGSGIQAVQEGRCDIGLSSRALKDEEKEAGLTETVLCYDGIAVIVNPANTVEDLTVEQIAAIYTGEITNWSELGGADAPIAVIGRDAASGTRGAFEEIVGVEDQCVYTNEYESTGEVIGSVAGNPNAIGYASLSAVDESVVAVKVNGVAPSEATVADGTYEIQRPFVMVTVEGTELSEAAQAFLEWAMSADAADEVEAAGCVSPNA